MIRSILMIRISLIKTRVVKERILRFGDWCCPTDKNSFIAAEIFYVDHCVSHADLFLFQHLVVELWSGRSP